jgi:hypothetical protein
MTDPRLRSTQPIDDELPFQEAEEVPDDDRPEDEDAIVTPAAAERARHLEDRDVERVTSESGLPDERG